MANTIRLRRGSGAPTAGSFVEGEPAWDSTNGRLYVKNAAGTMVQVGPVTSVNGSTGAITNLATTNTAQSFTAAQRGSIVALTSAATVTPDFAAGNHFSLTLGHNVTLANPTNQTAGQSGVITITQGASTAYTVAYGSNWKFSGGTPTMSTGLSTVSVLAYYVESTSRITAQLIVNAA